MLGVAKVMLKFNEVERMTMATSIVLATFRAVLALSRLLGPDLLQQICVEDPQLENSGSMMPMGEYLQTFF
jgi:hypothetical protein